MMLKTVGGKEIAVTVDADASVAALKAAVSAVAEAESPPVERQKLIHQGKVLGDAQLIRELELAPGSFVVLMVTKPQVVAPRPPAPAPAAAAATADSVAPPAPPPAAPSAATASADAEVLQALRQNPQFPQLQAHIQADPNALPALIQQLGQANPRLLEAIERNQLQFLTMLNEPVQGAVYDEHWGDDDDDDEDGDYDDGEMGDEDEDDVRNNMQLLQVLAGLNPQEREQFAGAMGVPPGRLQELLAMLNSLSPEDLQDLMAGDDGAVVDMEGQEFTAAEQESIAGIVALGFTEVEVVQAFLACNRNAEQAANLLFGGDDDA